MLDSDRDQGKAAIPGGNIRYYQECKLQSPGMMAMMPSHTRKKRYVTP